MIMEACVHIAVRLRKAVWNTSARERKPRTAIVETQMNVITEFRYDEQSVNSGNKKAKR